MVEGGVGDNSGKGGVVEPKTVQVRWKRKKEEKEWCTIRAGK